DRHGGNRPLRAPSGRLYARIPRILRPPGAAAGPGSAVNRTETERQAPGGVSMTKSSRLRDRWGGGEDPSVTQQRPQHARPSPGQGDDGLDMLAALTAFFEVEVPVRALAHHAGLRGHVEHPSQAAAVALG